MTFLLILASVTSWLAAAICGLNIFGTLLLLCRGEYTEKKASKYLLIYGPLAVLFTSIAIYIRTL